MYFVFYDNYVSLCNSIHKSPSAVALELGLQKATVTRWKKGGTPTDANAKKIADYFGISVASLFGVETENAPTPEDKRKISDDDVMFALWGDTKDVDKDDLDDVKRYAAFVKERKKKK